VTRAQLAVAFVDARRRGEPLDASRDGVADCELLAFLLFTRAWVQWLRDPETPN